MYVQRYFFLHVLTLKLVELLLLLFCRQIDPKYFFQRPVQQKIKLPWPWSICPAVFTLQSNGLASI